MSADIIYSYLYKTGFLSFAAGVYYKNNIARIINIINRI